MPEGNLMKRPAKLQYRIHILKGSPTLILQTPNPSYPILYHSGTSQNSDLTLLHSDQPASKQSYTKVPWMRKIKKSSSLCYPVSRLFIPIHMSIIWMSTIKMVLLKTASPSWVCCLKTRQNPSSSTPIDWVDAFEVDLFGHWLAQRHLVKRQRKERLNWADKDKILVQSCWHFS